MSDMSSVALAIKIPMSILNLRMKQASVPVYKVAKCNSLTQGSKKVEYDRRKVKVA